jgi:putative restriction endonuclease
MPIPYLQRFIKLNTDRSRTRWTEATRYQAPHKPLLLLAVLDLFAQGSITANLIELTPELGELFSLYWRRVMPPGRRGNIAMPFFHLKSDDFWHLAPRPGKEAILAAARRIHSINQLRETILGAQLDAELYELLCVEESRNLLRTALIETYFVPALQMGLVEQGAINIEAFHYSQVLLEQARTRPLKEAPQEDAQEYPSPARDQGFRRAIISAYDHRCAHPRRPHRCRCGAHHPVEHQPQRRPP